ncbi:MAG: MoaD/ThiS family protein [Actinomycetia bacterium]|nr:MoaD/ThiS family protein [Actinomycetes bacterium]MCP4958625.1 MoaD/ThiS family protein [Actinomycetes bacterium]
MAKLRLFAQAREAAGTSSAEFGGSTVGQVIEAAVSEYGGEFERVVQHSRVWCNGDPAENDTAVTDTDEVAVLPPVSGG